MKNKETLVKLGFALVFVIICIFMFKGLTSDYEIHSSVVLWELKARLQ